MSSSLNVNSVVLVVDDEPFIRDATAELLEEPGFATIRASNSDGAIHELELNPRTRILFTDLNMPGAMRGDGLVAYVEARWPAIGLIITSGHAVRAEIRVPDRCVFVSKPYGIENVASIMRHMIQDATAPLDSGPAA